MRLLINGLSARALSGWYVLKGHLGQLALNVNEDNHVSLLIDCAQSAALSDLPIEVERLVLDVNLHSWWKRWNWERTRLRAIVSQNRIHAVLHASGTVVGNLGVPEYTLALNPWCMMDVVKKSSSEKVKAGIQRYAYRRALRDAAGIYFCSEHLRRLYEDNNAGPGRADCKIASIGLSEELVQIADCHQRQVGRKQEGLILCVSAMAKWKGADRVVDAVAILRKQGHDARLRLVGPWPDSDYARFVKQKIDHLKLNTAVEVTGQVSDRELYKHFSEAKVFCLLSQAESFGIPALQAQAFGTPVVGATGCAMPEIGGEGGIFVEPTDTNAATDALASLLSNTETFHDYSQAARENARRYSWRHCSACLVELLNQPGV